MVKIIFLVIWVYLLICILAAFLNAYFKRAQCPVCRKRNAVCVSQKKLREENIYFKEKKTIKEYKNIYKSRTDFGMKTATDQFFNPPEKLIVRDVMIPGKRIWYKIKYKCNNCGNTFYNQVYEDKKPTVINKQ